MSWNVFRFILCIEREHPDQALARSQVVNYPQIAALSATCSSPSHFPNSARAGNDYSLFWILCERRLESEIILVGHVLSHEPSEERCFNKSKHHDQHTSETDGCPLRVPGNVFDMQ